MFVELELAVPGSTRTPWRNEMVIVKFRSQVLFLGLIDVGAEEFTFTNLEHARCSKDLILKGVRPALRWLCRVKLTPELGRM